MKINKTKITRFQDVPQFTRNSPYQVDVGWDYLESTLTQFAAAGGMDMDPDFQRAHVWTEAQQIAFVEFVLRGGRSAMNIYWNCPTWQRHRKFKTDQPIVLVDGKQRLEAARRFMRSENPAFGSLYREYTDRMRITTARFTFHVNDLETRAEVLQWYLEFNTGGTPHTPEEIEKVRKMLEVVDTGDAK